MRMPSAKPPSKPLLAVREASEPRAAKAHPGGADLELGLLVLGAEDGDACGGREGADSDSRCVLERQSPAGERKRALRATKAPRTHA